MNRKNILKGLGVSGSVSALIFAIAVSANVSGSLLPQSDGNYTSWTKSTGSTHYTLVDETVCNGTTDYNFTSTVGNRDSYGVSISSIPTGSKITQIDITPCASRNASGGTNPVMNVFYRYSGVNSSDFGSYSLTGTTPTALATTSYTSLSLFKSSGSTLEAGAVLTSGTKGARLSRIQTFITYTTLDAPTILVATPSTTTAGKISLAWIDNATIEDSYAIERSTDNLNWTQIATTSTNAVSYSDTGLSLGTLYYHRVRAYDAGGYSSYSNTASSTTENLPSAPSSLLATASGTNIDLVWTDNSSNETNFNIERGTDGVNFIHLATTTLNTTSYSDSSVVGGTTYYYRVNSYRAIGYSSYSNTSSSTALSLPSSPSNTNANALSTSVQINVTWTDNSSNEDNFEVERSTDAVNYSNIATTTAGTVSYSDTSISEATLYYYKVRASNVLGYSSYSNATSTTSSSHPPAPSSLTAVASATSTLKISLNWLDNSSNETNFEVLRSTDGTNFSHLATTSANVKTYSDTAITEATLYYYQVRGYNAIGYSSVSNTASDTSGSRPSDPTGATATPGTSTVSIRIDWTDASSNENNFLVERSPNGSTSWVNVATTTANTITYNNTGLAQNTTHYYRVRAVNGIGYSGYTSVVSATTPYTPSAPTGLVSSLSGVGINLDWTDNSSNETSFNIERSLNGITFSHLATTSADVINYLDTGLSSTTTYYYRLNAYNDIGYSAYSSVASSTTP